MVPTCQGNFYIPRTQHGPIQMDLRKKAADEIDAQNMIEVKIIGAQNEAKEPPKVDYSQYPIQSLKSLAASLKIPGFFTMRKTDLIKKLEETQ